MWRFTLTNLLARFLMVVVVCFCQTVTAVETITFAQFEIVYPPYQFVKDGRRFGPDLDILLESFRRMPDYDLNVQVMPIRRSILEYEKGEVDLVLTYRFKYYQGFSLYTDIPLHRNIFRPTVLKGKSFKVNSLVDLYGGSYATLNFNPLSAELLEAEQSGKLEIRRVGSYKILLNMLAKSRIDAILSNPLALLEEAAPLKIDLEVIDFEISPPRGVYPSISLNSDVKNKKDLRDKLNTALLSIHVDGTFQKILSKYGIVLTEEHSPLAQGQGYLIDDARIDTGLFKSGKDGK